MIRMQRKPERLFWYMIFMENPLSRPICAYCQPYGPQVGILRFSPIRRPDMELFVVFTSPYELANRFGSSEQLVPELCKTDF